MAHDLGKRLLAEVEEIGLDEIFHSLQLRTYDQAEPIPYFGIPALDRILFAAHPSTTARSRPSPPIIELATLTPGGGSTHLLYHLAAIATIPRAFGGKQGSVIIVDTDNTFSMHRLAQQVTLQINSTPHAEHPIDIEQTMLDSLAHIHILRPQTLASTIASLQGLTNYLFDAQKHHSIDRAIAFLALDSATAFFWQARAADEEEPSIATRDHPASSSTHTTLAVTLQKLSQTLACPLVLTAHYSGPIPTIHHYTSDTSVRPVLPAALAALPSLRFLVRRIAVRKFPAGMCVSEAQREAGDRQRVVDAGRFDCAVNFWGLDERRVSMLRREKVGFGFTIKEKGLVIEQDGKEVVEGGKEGEEAIGRQALVLTCA